MASTSPSTTAATPQSGWRTGMTSLSSTTTLVSHHELDEKDLLKVDDELLKECLQSMPCSEILSTLTTLARKAGAMMLDPSAGRTTDTKNNTSDLVTETDRAIEDMLKSALATAYPDYAFFGEETSTATQKLTDKPTFIVDPIDGTLNFTHGFPNFAVSLGLTLFKRPVIGVVYNPSTDMLFSGVKGQGATLTTLRGSRVQSLPIKPQADLGPLNKSVVAIEWGNDRQGARWELRTRVHKELLTKSKAGIMLQSVRSLGSAALDFCYVSAGWIDAFWEAGCWPWDVCAGWAILEEAGGRVFSANPGEEAGLETRLYFAVRTGGQESQERFANLIWDVMGGERFEYESRKKAEEKNEEDALEMKSLAIKEKKVTFGVEQALSAQAA